MLMDNPREVGRYDSQRGTLLGPEYGQGQIEGFLEGAGAVWQSFEDDQALCEHVAALMADEKVIGWMQGRMEFGPRALGSRTGKTRFCARSLSAHVVFRRAALRISEPRVYQGYGDT